MKTLVVDKIYQPVGFISLRKLSKYLAKDKVTVESVWENEFFRKAQKYPAVVVLKEFYRKRPIVARFSKKGVFKRDMYICQYTGQALTGSDATIDHIIPKSRGGKTSWENCVTTSFHLNSCVKKNKTPEEAGLKLIAEPKAPAGPMELEFANMEYIHNDWVQYFPNVRRRYE
jgi:hypothetical protein